MATIDSLKQALGQKAKATQSPQKPLSDTEYSDGFDILMQGSEWITYQDFIIPQLSQLLTPLINSRVDVSVLEIGPGPKSLFGYLPLGLRQKIRKYTAIEPSCGLASKLEDWLSFAPTQESPLPCLKTRPKILQIPFVVQDNVGSGSDTRYDDEKYDIILFCHSMYGMKPKNRYIEQALGMLVEQPQGGMVVVFHRDPLHLDDLVCHRTASFPTGVVSVANDDKSLDCFAGFVAGFRMQDMDVDKAVRNEWREVCRSLGRREEGLPTHIYFSSPNIMVAFTQHGTMLPDLIAQMPSVQGDKTIKNREARTHRPASIIRPMEIRHVQQCVQWALKHGVGLTVLGGGHSGHCLWPNVVSLDMSAFGHIHILKTGDSGRKHGTNSEPLVVAGTGCKTGDIVSKAIAAGLIVPLGSRPSVGAGLWLQGGIGHLARQHGLACDAIVGAVIVCVKSSKALCIGNVPSQYWPIGAVRPDNESELLWAIKGAGTNFGIIISITFKAYTAPNYVVREWVVPLSDDIEARLKLSDFDKVASKLPRNISADAYLYWDNDQLHLGVTMFESSTSELTLEMPTPTSLSTIFGPATDFKIVDSVGLFDTEMYVSGMHGGHGGGKTSSFKRCLFLKHIGGFYVANILLTAIETRPSPLCYLHLLQGGGAVGDVAADATAFGCRDWDFACVITGVWPRGQDGTEAARAAVEWVYDLARKLLPLSTGAYGSDLGPDPRDRAFAVKAFGLNQPRLARIKHNLDPYKVLAYACPLPKAPEQKLVILVTGESCAGKDYCAGIWVSEITRCTQKSLTVRAVSISDETKRQYAAATGADLDRLLHDRAYKEQHRSELTKFFQDQVQQQPRLPEQSFLNTVSSTSDVDVLLITGMRDEAPVAGFSHLVPDSKLLEVRVETGEELRQLRRGYRNSYDNDQNKETNNSQSELATLNYRPSFIFENNAIGNDKARMFAEKYLLPFLHEDLQRLAHMVRKVPDFPRPNTEFHDVLGIVEQLGGLALCTSLLQSHFTGNWTKVDAIAYYGAGSVFASALASRVCVPKLLVIREAGKLPPPTVSVAIRSSYISSLASCCSKELEKRIEMRPAMVSRDASVVVVDDVLSTGETLCAMLQLLEKAGLSVEGISVMVVAEFPIHGGRGLLRRHGFGRINIQSLLVFGGA